MFFRLADANAFLGGTALERKRTLVFAIGIAYLKGNYGVTVLSRSKVYLQDDYYSIQSIKKSKTKSANMFVI